MTEIHPMMFVNLPVRDLGRATAFFEALGFRFDPRFTDDKASCMVVSERAYVMLLTRPFFETFTDRPPADPKAEVGAMYALSFDSRADVDAFVDKAIAAGGRVMETKDFEFMYQRSFVDLDGHQWEPFFMDMAAFEAAQRVK